MTARTRTKPAAAPQPPATDDMFRARLEPEISMSELEGMAAKALRIAARGLANHDDVEFEAAIERLVLRWQQWDELAPEASRVPWVYRKREEALWAFLERLDAPSAALWDAYYQALAQTEGVSVEVARRLAGERVAFLQSGGWA